MTRHVLIQTEYTDQYFQPVIVGIFAKHTEANAVMQDKFDERKQSMIDNGSAPVDEDDSDASHFYLDNDNDPRIDWWISSFSTF